MRLTDRIVPSADVVAREVAGELVLLDLASGTYFGLDPVGGRLWQWASEEGATLALLAERLTHHYEVSREQAEADVLALAQDLAEQGLWRVAG